jgi:hypothetical protein
VLVALGIGLLCGLLAALQAWQVRSLGQQSDFDYWWRAAQRWTGGANPYGGVPLTPGWPLPDRFFYPMPAVLAAWPVHALSLPAAAGVTLALSTAVLVWALSAAGWWRLWLLGSPGFILAIEVGQWSPLLTAAVLLPALGWACAIKPSIGLAHLCYRLDWRAAGLAAAFLLVSVAILPLWPNAWLSNLASLQGHPPPIATPIGACAALALFRWRQSEARLLFGLACVPQLLFFSDQLALGLVARSFRQLLALLACQWIAAAIWWASRPAETTYVAAAAPFVLAGVYVPALLVVLRRPNTGDLPAWIERLFSLTGMRIRRKP